ncbi:MAG: hypothetical protein AAB787_01240 [Patescibacteria group bacterium]
MKWLRKLQAFWRRLNDPELTDLVEKYGLEGRVSWQETNHRGDGLEITFVRIIHLESEKSWSLPPGFIAEAQKRLRRIHRKPWGDQINFPTPRAMTLEEVWAEAKSWSSYCALFNSTL